MKFVNFVPHFVANVAYSMTQATDTIHIGSRLELFVDDYLIDEIAGVNLTLHHPIPQKIAIVRDQLWEGNVSGYNTVFQDGDLYRMYYRGLQIDEETGRQPHRQVVCYAESKDGIHWNRPELRLVEFDGSMNNIIWVRYTLAKAPGEETVMPCAVLHCALMDLCQCRRR